MIGPRPAAGDDFTTGGGCNNPAPGNGGNNGRGKCSKSVHNCVILVHIGGPPGIWTRHPVGGFVPLLRAVSGDVPRGDDQTAGAGAGTIFAAARAAWIVVYCWKLPTVSIWAVSGSNWRTV